MCDETIVNNQLRTICWVGVFNMTQTTCYRYNVDRGITTTYTNNFVCGDFHTAFVERLQECNTRYTVRCAFPLVKKQAATSPTTNSPKNRIKIFFEISN